MDKILSGLQSFVNSVRTNDHYASYDPSRSQGRDAEADPLAAEAASRRSSSSSYVPGMRSAQMSSSSVNLASGTSGQGGSNSAGGIPLSDLGPIPAPELSWERIDTWIESNYPELFDQLLEGATSNDLYDLEHDLDCVLPEDVKKSYSVHDGQERGGKPTGLFFGITFLDIESVSEEWNVWRRAALKLDAMTQSKNMKLNAGSSAHPSKLHSLSWISQQDSCPPDAVKSVYAHPSWIPLAKDWNGNNIAVDLSPGPKGNYGQVILYGRDFDTKYVVAPSWGDFLAQFAADLESGQSHIDDDIELAVFAFKSPTGQLVSYFNVMRQRIQRNQPQQPRRSEHRKSSAGNSGNNSQHVPATHAPGNLGRVTSRVSHSGGSSTSLSSRDQKSSQRASRTLPDHLNEVDLSDDVQDSTTIPSVSLDNTKSSSSLISTGTSISPKASAKPSLSNLTASTPSPAPTAVVDSEKTALPNESAGSVDTSIKPEDTGSSATKEPSVTKESYIPSANGEAENSRAGEISNSAEKSDPTESAPHEDTLPTEVEGADTGIEPEESPAPSKTPKNKNKNKNKNKTKNSGEI